jgi:hypothetical protein
MAAVGLSLSMYVLLVARGPLQSHSEEVAFLVYSFSVLISLAGVERNWLSQSIRVLFVCGLFTEFKPEFFDLRKSKTAWEGTGEYYSGQTTETDPHRSAIPSQIKGISKKCQPSSNSPNVMAYGTQVPYPLSVFKVCARSASIRWYLLVQDVSRVSEVGSFR